MHNSADYNQNIPFSYSLLTRLLGLKSPVSWTGEPEAGLNLKGTMGNALESANISQAYLTGGAGLWSRAAAPQAECTPASAAAAPPPRLLPPAEPYAHGPTWPADPPDAPAAAEALSAQAKEATLPRQASSRKKLVFKPSVM